MPTDPTANPATALPEPAAVGSPPHRAPATAASAARQREQEQVTFWKSFFLGMTKPGELPVYHHSNLFYWWPVWAFGFLFAAITYFGDRHMALVPAGTIAAAAREVDVEPGKKETRDVLILKDKE